MPKRMATPKSAARSARMRSARCWLTRPAGWGENREKSGIASVKLCRVLPVMLCAMTIFISWRPGGAAAANRPPSPAAARASMVAGICPRALGWVDRPV